MNERSRLCSDWRRRDGLTLVEVVAGLLLMSTLLVGILMACGRHVRQTKRAQQRLVAAAAADRLLAEWFRDPQQGFSGNGSGQLGGSGLIWQTRLVDSQNVSEAMNMEVVRLEILDSTSSTEQEPLIAVEVAKRLRPAGPVD